MVSTTRDSTRALRVLRAVVFLVIAGGIGTAQPQFTPKEHYKHGERLLKQDQVYEAFEEFKEAVRLKPNDKKYQRKLSEVGKVASVRAESEARQQLNINAVKAETLLRRAVEYDQANSSAVASLANVRNSIEAARGKLSAAQAALDAGDLLRVEETIKSLEVYREALLPGYSLIAPLTLPALEAELAAARRANAAQALWDIRQAKDALEQLSRAEREAPSSVYVTEVSKRIRREISDELVSKAAKLPKGNPSQVLDALKMASEAAEVDGTNEKALDLAKQTSSVLADVLLGRRRLFVATDASSARVALEALRTAEPWIRADARLADEKHKLESLAYPALTARVVVGDSTGCSPSLTRNIVEKTLRDSLGRVLQVSDQQADIVVVVKRTTCSSTDIPKQKSEAVNSTYVAGHNQLANPYYVSLQSELFAAEQELNRAVAEAARNPNFSTGLAKGLAEGRVANLRRALARTSPYITREVVQQYQYEKFEAYRSYQIEATIQVSSKLAVQRFTVERNVSFLAEDHSEGIAGVLPEDKSQARNLEPRLLPMERMQSRCWQEMRTRLTTGSRELVGGYLASRAMNRTLDETNRLSALLYLLDLADGTSYERERATLGNSVGVALLSGPDRIKSLLGSVSLSVPEQVLSEAADEVKDLDSTKTMLDRAVESAVAIETDTGTEGSGFFVTPACLVVTNEHVVGGADTIVLKTSTKRLFTAQVLARDTSRDLALLQTNARSCSAMTLEDSGKAFVGQEIYAIGNPLGLSGTVTKGIISALRTVGSGISLIQLDATINPGSSGGPPVTKDGKVLGVTTFKRKGFEGLNFAVASNEIRNAFARFLR
ncbi:MAG TPA: trypsin-like peptidase domain-containing protein [Blastocatellia bacterium]|nr:trypsin-like peptidase domain-containing protein [Blastocatellia bacterium]